MNSPSAHRIDAGQHEPPPSRRPRGARSTVQAKQGCNAVQDSAGSSFGVGHLLDQDPSSQSLLALHGEDLIHHLQSWAAELDAREAQINARASLQDHRERQFRIQQRDTETDLAERQRQVDRIRETAAAQARRLAFRES